MCYQVQCLHLSFPLVPSHSLIALQMGTMCSCPLSLKELLCGQTKVLRMHTKDAPGLENCGKRRWMVVKPTRPLAPNLAHSSSRQSLELAVATLDWLLTPYTAELLERIIHLAKASAPACSINISGINNVAE